MRKSKQSQISDSLLLKIISVYFDCLKIMTHTSDQVKISWDQLARTLKIFFDDAELFEKCIDDLQSANTQEQDTDPETDEEQMIGITVTE